MSGDRLNSCNTLTAGLDRLATNCKDPMDATMDLDALIAVLWLLNGLQVPFIHVDCVQHIACFQGQHYPRHRGRRLMH